MFATPSPRDIWLGLRDAFRTHLPGTDAWIEPNNLSVSARVIALAFGSAYERLQYGYRQLFASTADDFHLEYRHAFEFGVTRKPAAAAQGLIAFRQTLPAVSIPAGYTIAREDGVIYAFAEAAIPDVQGFCVVRIQATTTGANTNMRPGEILNFTADALYPTLPSSATVEELGIGGGADIESDESLRARVLHRKRNPPQGGSKSDYERWALEVPGVTRAFVSPFHVVDNDAHTPLTVFPIFDDTRTNGIPGAYDLLNVALHIDDVRPVTSRVYIRAATPYTVDINIAELRNDSPQLRAAIKSNLSSMFHDRVPVVTGDNKFTLPIAWINEAVSRNAGYDRHKVTNPASDLSFPVGALPILGTVSFGA